METEAHVKSDLHRGSDNCKPRQAVKFLCAPRRQLSECAAGRWWLLRAGEVLRGLRQDRPYARGTLYTPVFLFQEGTPTLIARAQATQGLPERSRRSSKFVAPETLPNA